MDYRIINGLIYAESVLVLVFASTFSVEKSTVSVHNIAPKSVLIPDEWEVANVISIGKIDFKEGLAISIQ